MTWGKGVYYGGGLESVFRDVGSDLLDKSDR